MQSGMAADAWGRVPCVGESPAVVSGVAEPASFPVAARPVFPAIDGLRALAVLPVVVEHGGLHVDEHQSRAAVDLHRFYYRRVARLLPALIAVTVLTAVTLIMFDVAWSTFAAGFFGSLTFTTDLLLASHLAHHVSTAFEWSWSLGTEEQFYLLWPALLLLSLRRWPRPRPLVAGLAVLAVAVVIERPILSTP
jgi:peptidoglycan/LPS O-acetylase OafA/YrhL